MPLPDGVLLHSNGCKMPDARMIEPLSYDESAEKLLVHRVCIQSIRSAFVPVVDPGLHVVWQETAIERDPRRGTMIRRPRLIRTITQFGRIVPIRCTVRA